MKTSRWFFVYYPENGKEDKGLFKRPFCLFYNKAVGNLERMSMPELINKIWELGLEPVSDKNFNIGRYKSYGRGPTEDDVRFELRLKKQKNFNNSARIVIFKDGICFRYKAGEKPIFANSLEELVLKDSIL